MTTYKEKDIITILGNIPVFQGLAEADYAEIMPLLKLEKFSSGVHIIKEGARGDSMCVIISGAVKITKSGEAGEEILLDTFYAGSYFGEFSLVDNMPRSANAISVDETELFRLEKKDFDALLARNGAISSALLQELPGGDLFPLQEHNRQLRFLGAQPPPEVDGAGGVGPRPVPGQPDPELLYQPGAPRPRALIFAKRAPHLPVPAVHRHRRRLPERGGAAPRRRQHHHRRYHGPRDHLGPGHRGAEERLFHGREGAGIQADTAHEISQQAFPRRHTAPVRDLLLRHHRHEEQEDPARQGGPSPSPVLEKAQAGFRRYPAARAPAWGW